MILKLLRLLKGYIIFTAVGGFSERFINLCAFRRIDIWDMYCKEDCITGKIDIKNFSKLRSIARKTGVKIKINNKIGARFYLRAHNDRVGLLIGVGFFIIFLVTMNRFVWCISTHDSEKFSREQIVEVAESVGLRYGVYVPGFDEEKAAREIYKAFGGELSYVKVNIKGSLAAIEFRDSIEKLIIEEKGEPSNIVADFDGVIVSDEIFQGAKNIAKGNAVKKGDVLISGVVEGVDSKPLYYEAKGNYTALHESKSEYEVSCVESAVCFSGTEEYYKLILFGLRIPIGFHANSDENTRLYTDIRLVEYDGYKLPFGIEKNRVAVLGECSIDKEKAIKIACMKYSAMVYDKYKNSNIVSCDVRIKTEEDRVILTGEYNCIDFIGESKPIIIEKIEN